MLKISLLSRYYSIKSATLCNKMKYLNVAEKNDAAKTIAGHLSHGSSRRREGLSPYNKIYEFQTMVRGTNADMVMTSVSGHLLNYEFIPTYKSWQGCNPISLFEAPVRKFCPENYIKIKQTLEREIRSCGGLIIWTDCDREGENIGFEIIEVCKAVKPNIPIYRAKFSEITAVAAKRAIANLISPDELQNAAVDVRTELDLRIGAAFTRFQTMRFQRIFPTEIQNKLVSYGSCQIPTLGFVAERYKENENFIPQAFWKIKLTHVIDDLKVEYTWNRNRLFDKQCCEALFMVCQANPKATVINVTLKPKSKWRPLPMDTIALEKLGSKMLKISAKETMTIAEKLYTQGFISYPRTETNIFSTEMDLRPLVDLQKPNPNWGGFAEKVLQWGPSPRVGKKSDQAHPPIHPIKFTTNLSGNEQRVYELVVRHFLACVSRDATGSETVVNVNIADEEFTATGLVIHERNYLEVYIYEKWNSKEIHSYQIGHTFDPTELSMAEGTTTAPSMLTEAELIALMDKHGIGTDATHAEHINTIKERGYIGEIDRGFLVPGTLGMGLVEGYDAVDLPLAQPKLRAALEKDLKLICSGQRDPKEVLAEQINIYREAFRLITEKARAMDISLGNRLQTQPNDEPEPPLQAQLIQEVFKCPKCSFKNAMALKSAKQNSGFVISCLGYPECKNAVWLPTDIIKNVVATDEICSVCGPGFKKLKCTLKSMHLVSLLNVSEITGLHHTSCIVCDSSLRNLCDIQDDCVKKTNALQRLNTTMNSSSYVNPNTRRNISYNNRNVPNERNHQQNVHNISRTDINVTPVVRNSSAVGWGLNQNQPPNPVHRNIPNNTRLPLNPTNIPQSNTANRSTATDIVKCRQCDQPARKLTVRKEGPNTGRQFYTCKTECSFFQWADETSVPSTAAPGPSTWGQNTTNYRPSNNNTNTGDAAARSKRKCGICRQEGHTKLKCPRRVASNM